MFSIRMEERYFGRRLGLVGVDWTVERMNWRAVGGPWQARLRARGDSPARERGLLELLRCPVVVNDRLGPCWWGYVSAVSVGGLRVSLDGMANKVSVKFGDLSPEGGGGAGRNTAWVSDEDSIREYGTKERVVVLGGAAEVGEATAAAWAALRRLAWPERSPAGGTAGAVVECRGWWETLDWRFYVQPEGRIGSLSVGHGASQAMGGDASCTSFTQTIRTGAAGLLLAEVWLKVAAFGTLVDEPLIRLRSDTGTGPGDNLKHLYCDTSLLSGDLQWLRFAPNEPFQLAANTTYYLHVARTSGGTDYDAEHYYRVGVDEGLSYPDGEVRVYWVGKSWQPREPDADLQFLVVGVEDTAAQAKRILSPGSCGQFISDARVEVASGVKGRLWRAGSRRGRVEVEQILATGTAGGTRLLARVNEKREVVIYPQPAADVTTGNVPGRLEEDGRLLRHDGRALEPGEQPAGRWARLNAGDEAGAVFVESCTWEQGIMRLGA